MSYCKELAGTAGFSYIYVLATTVTETCAGVISAVSRGLKRTLIKKEV